MSLEQTKQELEQIRQYGARKLEVLRGSDNDRRRVGALMLAFANQVSAFRDELSGREMNGALYEGTTDAKIGFSLAASNLLEVAGDSDPPFRAAQGFFLAARAGQEDLDATSEGIREVLGIARELADKIGQVAGGASFESGLSTVHGSHAGTAADQAENALAVLGGYISDIA